MPDTAGEDYARRLRTEGWFSFPFPRWAGRAFTYNEFCLAATLP